VNTVKRLFGGRSGAPKREPVAVEGEG